MHIKLFSGARTQMKKIFWNLNKNLIYKSDWQRHKINYIQMKLCNIGGNINCSGLAGATSKDKACLWQTNPLCQILSNCKYYVSLEWDLFGVFSSMHSLSNPERKLLCALCESGFLCLGLQGGLLWELLWWKVGYLVFSVVERLRGICCDLVCTWICTFFPSSLYLIKSAKVTPSQ